jgi:hypothetical protein
MKTLRLNSKKVSQKMLDDLDKVQKIKMVIFKKDHILVVF